MGMSQEFFDPELFADFIAEAKEHLETIEPNLLELEKTPDNLAWLNDIFRPMHSLKGASGFLGLNRINLLAHRSENILDELRKDCQVIILSDTFEQFAKPLMEKLGWPTIFCNTLEVAPEQAF